MSVRTTIRLTALACVTAVAAMAALSGASAAKTGLTTTKTFTLPANTTRTFNVGYPQALKHKGAEYSCTTFVSGLGKKYVKILSRGPALGGSVCRVKARNTAKLPSLDTTAKVKVTATTTF
jgi:hypothetical protein